MYAHLARENKGRTTVNIPMRKAHAAGETVCSFSYFLSCLVVDDKKTVSDSVSQIVKL